MTKRIFRTVDMAGLVLCSTLLTALIGCVREAPSVETATAVVSPPVAAPAPATVEVDDYVYYPSYEVYYSSNRRQYRYRDGNAWVFRAAPPRVAINVLLASPSVHMDFHDTPERHHETVVRSYPRNWTPRGRDHDDKDRRKDDRKDDHKDDRKDDDKKHN